MINYKSISNKSYGLRALQIQAMKSTPCQIRHLGVDSDSNKRGKITYISLLFGMDKKLTFLRFLSLYHIFLYRDNYRQGKVRYYSIRPLLQVATFGID